MVTFSGIAQPKQKTWYIWKIKFKADHTLGETTLIEIESKSETSRFIRFSFIHAANQNVSLEQKV